jgi:hypothetical protein
MTDLAGAYLIAAEAAASLLEDPAVAAAWHQQSALADFGVSGLAGHLASQVLNVDLLLETKADPATPTIDLEEHYSRVGWRGAAPEADINVGIRAGGEQTALAGVAAVAAEVRAAIERLRTTLPGADGAAPVVLPWTGWALTFDDFLTTRMMELAVHSDDLAVSVGVPTPALPVRVMHPVFDLLFVLALRRHGQVAMLRALSRAERAPDRINAI